MNQLKIARVTFNNNHSLKSYNFIEFVQWYMSRHLGFPINTPLCSNKEHFSFPSNECCV